MTDPLAHRLRTDPALRTPADPSALGAVVARGRRRRAGYLGGLGTTTAVAAALVLAGQPGAARDALDVVPAATPTASPSHAAPTPHPLDGRDSGAAPAAAGAAPGGTQATPAAPVRSAGAASRQPEQPQPWHRPMDVYRSDPTNPEGVTSYCVNADGPALSAGGGWCALAVDDEAASRRAPTRLRFQVCKTGAPAQLGFATAQEIDVVVLRGGQVAWTWSRGLRFAQSPRTRDVPSGACWTWRTTWNGTRDDGVALPAGRYEVRYRLLHRTGAPELAATSSVEVSR